MRRSKSLCDLRGISKSPEQGASTSKDCTAVAQAAFDACIETKLPLMFRPRAHSMDSSHPSPNCGFSHKHWRFLDSGCSRARSESYSEDERSLIVFATVTILIEPAFSAHQLDYHLTAMMFAKWEMPFQVNFRVE